MELTTSSRELAAATTAATKLLGTRRGDPMRSALLLTGDSGGLRIAGAAEERAVTLHCRATVHTDGEVLVPGRPLAETVHALDAEQLTATVEGTMLALRTPNARFALPLLDAGAHPGVRPPPPALGELAAEPFAGLARVVAGACSADLTLPMFTGVRVRSLDSALRLVATDRYRMAVADLPWSGSPLDVLAPGGLLAEVARQATPSAAPHGVTVHADEDRFALGWSGGTVTTSLLATPFVDERRYLGLAPDVTVEADADALAAAVHRVGLYADGRGAVLLDPADGEVRVHSTAADGVGFGEASETVKAAVRGRHAQYYRSGYLLDALRSFAGTTVRLGVIRGMKPTTLSSDDLPELQYVVMPILSRS